MNQIEVLLNHTAEFLNMEIPQADFYTDSRDSCEYAPLQRPVGILRLIRLETGDTALNDYIGTDSGDALLGKRAVAVLGISLYSPTSEAECRDIFATIAEALLFYEDVTFQEISCDTAEYRVREEAFHLETKTKLTFLMTKAKSENTADRFRLRAIIQ